MNERFFKTNKKKKKNRESGSPLIMMEGFIILPKRRARFFSFSFFKYTTRESEVTHSFSFLHPFFLFIYLFSPFLSRNC